MTGLERQLREVLHDPSWALPAPADPAAWAKARAGRRRWRTTFAALAAAATAGTAALVAPGLLQPASDEPSSLSWTRLADAPVSPRLGALAAWTGREALFLGGETGDPVPPTASSTLPVERARDGAAYDVEAGSWRRTAPSPVDLPTFGDPAVVGDTAHLLVDGELVAYDASDDAWSRWPGPPGPQDGRWTLEAVDGRLVALRDTQSEQWAADQQYDAGSATWQALPRDPLVPTVGRRLTATPSGWLLTGFPEATTGTPRLRAALLDEATGTWAPLPDAPGGGYVRTWTGTRFVSVDTNLDGDESDVPGKTFPRGVALDLDRRTWSLLEGAPEEYRQGWPLDAVAGDRIATGGYRYEDARASWTLLTRPEGAPPRGTSAVWADDVLLVLGGFDESGGYTSQGLSRAAFRWGPPLVEPRPLVRYQLQYTGPVLIDGGGPDPQDDADERLQPCLSLPGVRDVERDPMLPVQYRLAVADGREAFERCVRAVTGFVLTDVTDERTFTVRPTSVEEPDAYERAARACLVQPGVTAGPVDDRRPAIYTAVASGAPADALDRCLAGVAGAEVGQQPGSPGGEGLQQFLERCLGAERAATSDAPEQLGRPDEVRQGVRVVGRDRYCLDRVGVGDDDRVDVVVERGRVVWAGRA